MTSAKTRLSVVDGLRAVAIVAVVLFHSFPQYVRGGFIGVDVFFVISGFVIALRYLEPMISNETRFSTFFLRRIRRLVPAYLALLIVTTAFAAWLLVPGLLVDYGISLLSQVVYAQNVAFWNIGDYFDNALAKPLLHTWSLAVEEQFYFTFPLAILLLRWRRRPALAMLVLTALASIAAGYVVGHISPKTSFYWLPFRAWEFLAGIFAAYLFQRGLPRVSSSVGTVLLTLGSAAIVIAALGFDENSIFPGAQSLIAVAGTVAICLCQEHAGNWARAPFINPLAQHWGRISYSWYLWHWPPLSFYFVVTGHAAGLVAAVWLTILGYALGAISYFVFERWGLRSPTLRAPKRTLALLAIFLGFAGIAGGIFVAERGLIQRYPVREQPLLAAQADIAPYRCPLLRRLRVWREDICQLNEVNTPTGNVLIIGDSHADVAKQTIASMGTSAGIGVYLVKQNCRVIDYGNERSCPLGQWNAIMRQARQHGITKLVLISFWPAEFDPRKFQDAFERLSGSGMKIYLEQSTPYNEKLDPGSYLTRPDDWSAMSDYTRREHEAFRGPQEQFFAHFAASNPNVTLIDPVPLLCNAQRCAFSRDGQPLYRDSHHLTSSGIKLISPIYRVIFKP